MKSRYREKPISSSERVNQTAWAVIPEDGYYRQDNSRKFRPETQKKQNRDHKYAAQ